MKLNVELKRAKDEAKMCNTMVLLSISNLNVGRNILVKPI